MEALDIGATPPDHPSCGWLSLCSSYLLRCLLLHQFNLICSTDVIVCGDLCGILRVVGDGRSHDHGGNPRGVPHGEYLHQGIGRLW